MSALLLLVTVAALAVQAQAQLQRSQRALRLGMAVYLAILILMSLLNIQRLLRFVNLGAVATTTTFAGFGASKVSCTSITNMLQVHTTTCHQRNII
jgi:hypothetical protein